MKCQKKTQKSIKLKKKHVKKRKPRSKSAAKLNPKSVNLAPVEIPILPKNDDENLNGSRNSLTKDVEKEQLENIRKSAGKEFQKKLEFEQKLEKLNKDLADLQKSYNVLRPSDLNELASYVNPPPAIKLLMQLVCMVLGIPPDVTFDQNGQKILDFWRPAQVFLHTWKSDSFAIEKHKFSPKLLKMIPKIYFDSPKKMQRISSAARGFVLWLTVAAKGWKIKTAVDRTKVELKSAETELKLALDQWKDVENSVTAETTDLP